MAISENGKVARIGWSFELDAGEAFRRGLWDGWEAILSPKTYKDKEEAVFISIPNYRSAKQPESGENLPIKHCPTFQTHSSHRHNTSRGGVSILITAMQITCALIGQFTQFDKTTVGRISSEINILKQCQGHASFGFTRSKTIYLFFILANLNG